MLAVVKINARARHSVPTVAPALEPPRVEVLEHAREHGFAELLVHLVVPAAQPQREGFPRAHVGRLLP